jgi:NADH dehydrogenase [ubiquinone] 1 alpha subcomplex assembly factor 7
MKHKKNNLLSLDKFINLALYNRKFGYYMNKNPFGKKGDFITAPNISILFSEMIAIWIISLWEHLNCPKKFNLIELGAGNGEMMKSLISTFNKFPKFKSACKINILEKSDFLIKEQKKNIYSNEIKWLNDLNKLNKIPNIFIANEFFDALPFKQFIKKKNRWYERYVNLTDKKKANYTDRLFNMKKMEKKIRFNISQNQNFIEYSPETTAYLKIISKKIKTNNGALLIIDYGYLENKIKNTIQTISNHKYSDALKNIGKSDITHNISFHLLKKIVQELGSFNTVVTNQREFLIKMGIIERAEIISKNLTFKKKADIFFRLKRLIDTNEMGDLFKVMLITNKENKFKLGF